MRRIHKVTFHCAAIALVVCMLAPPSRSGTQKSDEVALPSHDCGGVSAAREWHYVVAARIRPLVFWTGWKEVGEARVRRNESESARHLELLIGTDPERAPRRINRWGYIVETACGPATQILGIMTASDEETMEEATTNVSQNGNAKHIFKVIRGSLTNDQAVMEILRVAVVENLTYRDVDVLLNRVPPPGPTRRAPVPSGARGGFLTAVSMLVQQSQAEYRQSGRLSPLPPQRFVFAGAAYDLTLRSAKLDSDLAAGGQTAPRAIKSEFEVRNRATGKLSRFKLEYTTDEVLGRVPLRVVYQPRWWLQIELRLRDAAHVQVAAE